MGNCLGFRNCFGFPFFSRRREGRPSTPDPQMVSSPSGREGRPSTLEPQTVPSSQKTVQSPISHQTGPQQTGSSQQTVPSPASHQTSPSQETPAPLSLDEVRDKLKAVDDVSKDELIKIIGDLLQRQTAGKSAEDKAESSQSVAPLFISSQQTVLLPASDQTGPSQQTPAPLSLDEVRDKLKAVDDVSKVDELIIIITDLLQRRTVGKCLEDKAESSRSVAPLFIVSGTTFLKFIDDHIEKSSNKEDFVHCAPQIIGDVLEKLGDVHWLVLGLSVIGSVLHTAETISENYKTCLDLLQKLVDLSHHLKKEIDYSVQDQEKKLKEAIVMIINGCILCAYEMSSHQLFRFLKASIIVEDLGRFGKGVDNLCQDFISTTLKQGTGSKYIGEDVFLSHSGVDKNFIRQLYRDLAGEGVSCFFDQSRESLPLAEKWAPRIFEAAETCRVAVLLLSMDFIQSRWPMLELSAFLQAKKSGKNSNLKILPLFFKISPNNLKDLTSDTQDIPDLTRTEISEKTGIEWKDISEALKEVRKINGLRFNGEDEVSFRDEIIKEIRTLLPPSPIVFMPVGSVGLAEGREKVTELLQLTSADTPRMAVVIYGFGGIGKTTLAEAVVAKINLEPYSYARVNFDIASSKKDIRKMQEQILNGLFPKRTKTKLTDCCQGRTVLTKELTGDKPIFLFIDNALRKQDLEELLPTDLKGLPKGSRILVTTRDLSATDMFIGDEAGLKRQEYVVQPLSDQEAQNFLLKGCADRQLDTIQEEDVKRVLKVCKGVPLVLKIVRGHFRKQGYRADMCSDILEDLERGKQIKEEDLGRTLTDFVYDLLEESSRQAFLDICCFFNDMDLSYVEYIVGAQALTSLEESAFVQRSDDKKTLIVHDIIRERGRNKAGFESTELGSMRIMNVESLIDAVNEKRLKDIRGVWLKDESEYVVEEQHLKAMTKLRVLALGKRITVSHPCKVTFKELRYLELGGDIPCLPVNIEGLQKLAFYVGPIFKKGFSMCKLPNKLRVLIAARQSDFNESTYSEESISIGTVKKSSLKDLDLSEFKNLQKVPRGLHLLISLEILRCKDWDRMEELPEEFCQLTMLTQLTLSGWTLLTCLPTGFERLRTLKNLSLYNCNALQCLPESFGQLTALETLELTLCTDLQCLPESFGELKAMKYLYLSHCRALQRLPESFGQLVAVETLELSSCGALQCVPESFGELRALKHLDLLQCVALKSLPASFGQLAAVETLTLSRCIALQCLPESFGELKALKHLDLFDCTALRTLPESFGQLAGVERLTLKRCRALHCLPESFGQLKALKHLYSGECNALERLPESFGQLVALEKIDLSCCGALQCLAESFGELKALKHLDLFGCNALKLLPESCGKLAAVESLDLRGCKALQCLPESSGELKALNELFLSGCSALKRLPESFGHLAALERLYLSGCTDLQHLPESFGELEALNNLDLSGCNALERLPKSFGHLASVERLNLRGCTTLQCLPESFVELKALNDLDLSGCNVLKRLPEAFGQLAAVKTLKLSCCTALQCLPESFGELRALEDLELDSCHALERLPESFGELPSLLYLKMADCPARADLSKFEANFKNVTFMDENE